MCNLKDMKIGNSIEVTAAKEWTNKQIADVAKSVGVKYNMGLQLIIDWLSQEIDTTDIEKLKAIRPKMLKMLRIDYADPIWKKIVDGAFSTYIGLSREFHPAE